MSSSTPLSPTFYGHIASTQDALVLFEACLNGQLNHVARRPHDRERASLIKSGNVFIYEEHSSGIKRWTDGVPWSPSRILGNFLVYRELERPFPPGEKKRAMKRSKRSPGISKATEPYGDLSSGMSSGYSAASTAASTFESSNSASSLNKETERSLIGSLIDSYGFKEEGLVKKTVSVTVAGISHHLVSYYTVADVMSNKFSTPTKDPRFAHTTPRSDLVTKQNFRTAIDEIDNMDRLDDRSPLYGSYPYPRNGYDMTNQNISQRTMSAPSRTSSFGHSPSLFNNGYNLNGSSGVYGDHFQSPTTTSNYASQFAPAPGIYPAPTIKSENQDGGAFRPRYNSVIGSSMDSNRSQMAPVPTNYSRRSSNFEHSGSIDSGISGVSSASVDSKVSSDSGYSSAAYYGTALRNTTNTSHAYATQRSLPTPHVATTYVERPPIHSYTMDNPSPKDNMWPIGNASAGHGHYMATQQPWASTGTS